MNSQKTQSSESENKAAEEFKTQGNVCFQQGDYERAIEYYTKALSLDSSNASYYSNRAACYLKLKKYCVT